MKNSDKIFPAENNLSARIKKLTDGLYYTSETDAVILPFEGKKAESVTAEELLKQIDSDVKEPVEEKDFNEFFARLTEMQDWFGDEEKATAQKFIDLQNLLRQNLQDLKVFRIGKIQINIYAVGIDAIGNLAGIQTKAVET